MMRESCEELIELRLHVKYKDKEIARLKEALKYCTGFCGPVDKIIEGVLKDA